MCPCAQAWDETDIFDLLVKNGGGEVVRGPNEGTSMASTYSTEQQELLLHLGQLLYSVFDDLITVFDYEAMNDPLTGEGTDKLSMLGFLHLLKKCNVPHPDVPMAAFDRIFVEVNWTADPSPDSSDKSMDLGEFMEALIRVAETRYAVEDPRPDMVESLRMLLEEKILPMAADAHADPFLGVWHSKDFLNRLAHKSQLLTKAFTSVSNVDADMHFFTMSLKEWTIFVNKLNIVGDGFAQRSIKDTFWRAQGAWAPEFGTMVALKEREEFLEKLHATDEQEAADHGNTQEMVRAGPRLAPQTAAPITHLRVLYPRRCAFPLWIMLSHRLVVFGRTTWSLSRGWRAWRSRCTRTHCPRTSAKRLTGLRGRRRRASPSTSTRCSCTSRTSSPRAPSLNFRVSL